MKRKAFLLGFYSIGGQVLLLRELVSSLNGDELFIGTALFGWLLSVAFGAQLGGLPRFRIAANGIFAIGALLLPVSLVVIRLLSLAVSDVVGEVIPFGEAALISIVTMFPVGMISGWLFSAITAEGEAPTDAIVNVYLLEGIGAFVGGVIMLITVGGPYSTLGMALAAGVAVIGALICNNSHWKVPYRLVIVAVAVVALIAIPSLADRLDRFLDSVKYAGYHVEKTFDTHYGRQAVLKREGSLILLTDNTVELENVSKSNHLENIFTL